MKKYILLPHAQKDLINIYLEGDDMFGEAQAEAYQEGFRRMFGLLCDFPYMGREERYGPEGWRKFKYEAHKIFYTVADGFIEIQTIQRSSFSFRYDSFDEDEN